MLSQFHPIVARWFQGRFSEPTDAQRLGWPEILAGRNVLIAAPTGSGKTLAAFLVCIDRIIRQAADGELDGETQVVYVSPLKALSNDVHRNLEMPLAGIRGCAEEAGVELPEIRVALRTGDTPASQRQAMLRRRPHILVTTPESLYLLLTSERSREILRGVKTVIVDEIHALARDKRGSHLALSLERLEALCGRPPVRVGLSATQRPMDEIARFLVGARQVEADGAPRCAIVDVGHVRELDLAIEVPPSELSAVCSHETWAEIYARLAELIQSHRSTLIFVNTRRLSERVCHHLGETLGEDAVASHHGSLSKEIRLAAERKLQRGELKAIVATASLELGIDVGYIDLVCQISSPRAIATFLQRVGRAGHQLRAVPKGRLFPLTRDDLMEAMALIRAVRQRRLDRIVVPEAPLDILAQQIVAAVAADEWVEEELFELCRSAWPFRHLGRGAFDDVLKILSEGFAPGTRRGSYLHRDRINGRLRARRGARIAALTSGGAIPDTADYRVVTEGEGVLVGTVNEDFAIESMGGDVFLLGNTSWRVSHVRAGVVTVTDAGGAPATIPFWLGEGPGRTIELSQEVSELRDKIAATRSAPATLDALGRECGASRFAVEQAVNYIASQLAAVGVISTRNRIVFERFFDESGGMQLVIHAPLGSRINRAWGLALRKRFCRSFNFELQAAADDNGIVLSLGAQHSFPLESMFKMVTPANAGPTLVQALLASPMFEVRWRWNVTRALAVLRMQSGKKTPPHLQRMRSDDLLTAVFPAQTACLEHITGDIEVPDHPLVRQTVYDCLHEAMDLDRWQELLAQIEAGQIEMIGCDTREASPFSYEILNANPYAFLDDAPLEERRARAVATRRTFDPADVDDLAALDPAAIAQVKSEAWPLVRDAEELHDALLTMVALPEEEGEPWQAWFEELVAAGRAARVPGLWIAAERWPVIRAAVPSVARRSAASCIVAERRATINLPPELDEEISSTDALVILVRGRIEVSGPVTAEQIAADLGLRPSAVSAALEALEGEGAVLRGNFRTAGAAKEHDAADSQWCDRRLLARIHRLTLDAARRGVQPVEPEVFWRFLIEHQHATPSNLRHGPAGLSETLAQLQGFESPGGSWERDVLPCRIADYDPAWLDELALGGQCAWGRLVPPKKDEQQPPSGSGITRVVPITLMNRGDVPWLLPAERISLESAARGVSRTVLESLKEYGALFFDDLLQHTSLLPAQLEDALSELAALGLVTSDGYATIRRLVSPDGRKSNGRRNGRRKRAVQQSYSRGGRWSRFPSVPPMTEAHQRTERWARQLLARWGVMFRDLLARENAAPPWRQLLPVYRRLEARGEIRGGRFVSGVAGEQYALPAALDHLRRLRDEPPDGAWHILSAADPLNLTGVLLPPASRVPAVASAALALKDGQVAATLISGEVRFLVELPDDERVEITRAIRISATARARQLEKGGLESRRLQRWNRERVVARSDP